MQTGARPASLIETRYTVLQLTRDCFAVQDGILGAIVIQEGGVANVGAPIAYVAESDADLQEAKSKVGAASSGNGAAPAQKEVPKEETAKVEAPVAAQAEAATTTAPPPSPPSPAPAAPAPAPQKRADGRVIATPYAKKLAKELGVDLNNLSGSGPSGRITASDVEGFKGGNGATPTAAPSQSPAPAQARASAPEPVPQSAAPSAAPSTSVSELKGTTEPFNALQAAVAKNMVESLNVSALRLCSTIRVCQQPFAYFVLHRTRFSCYMHRLYNWVQSLRGNNLLMCWHAFLICRPHCNGSVQVPEFRVAYSINTDALDALYKRLKPKGVTMSGLLAKAAGVALSKHPMLYAGLLHLLATVAVALPILSCTALLSTLSLFL